MNTKFPLLLVMALSLTGMMWGMSGIGDVLAGDSGADELPGGDQLNETRDEHDLGDGVEGAASGGSDSGEIVGLIISGAQSLVGILMLVILLPIQLEAMGLPSWFAYPMGVVSEILITIGLIQFVSGRVFD